MTRAELLAPTRTTKDDVGAPAASGTTSTRASSARLADQPPPEPGLAPLGALPELQALTAAV